ncbi:MAG: hypothetical protein ABFD18_06050 [Syntrophomonas sp.]
MFENFSRRNHLDRPSYTLKYEYIPPAFRMDIYKAVKQFCDNSVKEYCLYRDSAVSVNRDSFRLYTVEDVDERYNPDFFIEMLLDLEWHEMLSIIEFFLEVRCLSAEEVNKFFDYHKVGYRINEGPFGGEYKVVVYYEELLEDNEKLLEQKIPYPAVKESVEAAKRYLIDPLNIDVANSIKSSISAVEGYLIGYFNDRGKRLATLGDCIKEIRNRKICPENIITALEQFYIYRNRTKNVGHGSPDYADFNKDDALLCNEMAVSFINYFFRKS